MKVLIAYDDPATRKRLEATVAKCGYDGVVASTGAEAWEALQQRNGPRLAVLGWKMKGLGGIDICKRLAKLKEKHATTEDVYVILLTPKADNEALVQAIEAGARDYLLDPYESYDLSLRLEAGARVVSLQSKLTTALESSAAQAGHDAVTGVWNRRGILDILDSEVGRATRRRGHIAVLMAQMDHFERVSESCGHMGADLVLQQVVQRMLKSLRPYDHMGRYRSEEFLIVLSECSHSEAVSIAERICARVGDQPFSTPRRGIPATVSIGVAAVAAQGLVEGDALVREADAALDRARKAGGNCVSASVHSRTSV